MVQMSQTTGSSRVDCSAVQGVRTIRTLHASCMDAISIANPRLSGFPESAVSRCRVSVTGSVEIDDMAETYA